MAKHYSRKSLNSLEALNREQKKVKKAYLSMEYRLWESVLQPERIATSLISSLLSRSQEKRKGRKEGYSFAGGRGAAHLAVSWGDRHPALKGALKGIARSWLRWQAFNLAYFLGKKAAASFRERKTKGR